MFADNDNRLCMSLMYCITWRTKQKSDLNDLTEHLQAPSVDGVHVGYSVNSCSEIILFVLKYKSMCVRKVLFGICHINSNKRTDVFSCVVKGCNTMIQFRICSLFYADLLLSDTWS